MVKKAIWIDGGIGRNICAMPAIDELSKTEEIIVISSCKELFLNKKNIFRVYDLNQSYLWEDIIKENILLHPEPYWEYEYYNKKEHLINTFFKCLNIPNLLNTIPKPNVILNNVEETFVAKLLKSISEKPVLIFQPFGSSAEFNEKTNEVIDNSNRSLSMKDALYLVNALQKQYNIIYVGTIPIKSDVLLLPPQDLGIRGIISIISKSDYILAVDSVAQHIGYAFNIPGTIFIGGTDENNICYPLHYTIIKRDGYPKEYNPFRIPSNSHLEIIANDGAMDFEKVILDDVINKLNKRKKEK